MTEFGMIMEPSATYTARLATRIEAMGFDLLLTPDTQNLVCDPDEKRAIELARTITGLVAHFTGMEHASVDHLPPRLKPLAVKLKSEYDMKHHAQRAGSHLDLVDDAFVDWFAIAGPAQKCTDRLGALIDKGLEHVYILGGSPVASPHGERVTASVDQAGYFAADVLPHFSSRGF